MERGIFDGTRLGAVSLGGGEGWERASKQASDGSLQMAAALLELSTTCLCFLFAIRNTPFFPIEI